MNPNREEALFAMALEKAPEKRAAFLDAVCDGDAALRQRLEALLAAHEASAGVLGDEPAAGFGVPSRTRDGVAESPAEAGTPNALTEICPPPDEAVGMTLGRYKLREKIGEGGCGTVYVAEQTEPVRRRVALKVIKLGMDTREVIACFRSRAAGVGDDGPPCPSETMSATRTGPLPRPMNRSATHRRRVSRYRGQERSLHGGRRTDPAAIHATSVRRAPSRQRFRGTLRDIWRHAENSMLAGTHFPLPLNGERD